MVPWQRAATLALGVALAAVAGTAAAQPASGAPAAPAEAAEARRLAVYEQGVEAASAGRWADARARFAEALALRPSAKVFFSLAQAEEQLHEGASAEADYERALEAARAARENDVIRACEESLRAIQPRVPHLRVTVPATAGATATLDGRPLLLDAWLAIDRGVHHLVVSAPGTQPVSTEVTVEEGAHIELPVHIVTERAAPATAAPRAPVDVAPRWPLTRTLAVASAAAGAVGLGISGALALVARSDDQSSHASGCNGDVCTAHGAAVRREALSAASASTVAFVAGGVLLATGAALWLLGPSPARPAPVVVGATATSSGAGVIVSGWWR